MSYRQLLANLEALPEGERQLTAFRYILREDGKDVCGCVLGKGVPALRAFIADNPSLNHDKSIRAQVFAAVYLEGLTIEEADRAQEANDYCDVGESLCGEERRVRYAHMIEWLRARVSEESQAPQAL